MTQTILRKVGARLIKAVPTLRSDRDLANYMREHVLPIPPVTPDDTLNKPVTCLDPPGLDFRAEAQIALLASFRSSRHQALFKALRSDPIINKMGSADAVSNTYCNTPDAEIYASMILDRQPKRIVEVGSGFSTLVARKAVGFSGHGATITVIDPYPRTDVKAAADRLELKPVEQTDLVAGPWERNDLLFIDSSHICRTRGDLPYLFCKVIPSLPAGVLVHVHDIFLPFDDPNLYDQWCHTEEYLLCCLLAHNPRYRIVMTTHWLSRLHAGEMNATFGPFAGTPASAPHHFGCSFWFEVLGS